MMQPCATVTGVRIIGDYCLELTFADGLRGIVDLSKRIVGRGGAFRLLEDAQFFRQVRVDSELGTIAWPNEADFCPDLLHDWVSGQPIPSPEAETVVF